MVHDRALSPALARGRSDFDPRDAIWLPEDGEMQPSGAAGLALPMVMCLRGLRYARALLASALGLLCAFAQASVGLTEITGADGNGPVTVFYSSGSVVQPVKRGLFTFRAAAQGVPTHGNGRLVVISHGSGGAPCPLPSNRVIPQNVWTTQWISPSFIHKKYRFFPKSRRNSLYA